MTLLQESSQEIQQLAEEWPLCYEFKLPVGSTVIVAGAYQGRVMELLGDLYPDSKRIIGFDPQRWALDRATSRLLARNGLKYEWSLHNYGLGVRDEVLPMGEWNTNACSFINVGKGTREQGEGQLKEFSKIMTGMRVELIDLAVFNMEGYEFLLMPYLLQSGWSERIDRIAVQWHVNLGAGGYEDIDSIVNSWQEAGHKLIYDHRPQWTYTENWKRWESIK